MPDPQVSQRNEWALELVIWYQKQPNYTTMKTDAEIAAALDWYMTRRERQALGPIAIAMYPKGVKPVHFRRVRDIRRFIDRDETDWAGYNFGTRKNGRGGSISTLTCPEMTEAPFDAMQADAIHVVGQVQREIQRAKQMQAELDRIAAKLLGAEIIFREGGDHDRATAVAMAASDVRRGTGELLSPDTVERLFNLGLL
jgi:hypothetical protein